MGFFLVPLREKRGIGLRDFEMGVVLSFCILLGGRKRKNMDQVRDGCVVARGRGAGLPWLL